MRKIDTFLLWSWRVVCWLVLHSRVSVGRLVQRKCRRWSCCCCCSPVHWKTLFKESCCRALKTLDDWKCMWKEKTESAVWLGWGGIATAKPWSLACHIHTSTMKRRPINEFKLRKMFSKRAEGGVVERRVQQAHTHIHTPNSARQQWMGWHSCFIDMSPVKMIAPM